VLARLTLLKTENKKWRYATREREPQPTACGWLELSKDALYLADSLVF
jgi:hypothetical protein